MTSPNLLDLNESWLMSHSLSHQYDSSPSYVKVKFDLLSLILDRYWAVDIFCHLSIVQFLRQIMSHDIRPWGPKRLLVGDHPHIVSIYQKIAMASPVTMSGVIHSPHITHITHVTHGSICSTSASFHLLFLPRIPWWHVLLYSSETMLTNCWDITSASLSLYEHYVYEIL